MPLYTEVPILPMFLVEDGSNPTSLLSNSSHHVSQIEEVVKKPKRKSKRRCSFSNQSLYETPEKCNRHHHQHKQKIHQAIVHASADNLQQDDNSESRQRLSKSKKKKEHQMTFPNEDKKVTTEKLLMAEPQIHLVENIKRKTEEIRTLNIKLSQFEKKTEDLEKQRDILKAELEAAQHKTVTSEAEEITTLVEEKSILADDVHLLKNLVYRLNVELQMYQERFHKQGYNVPEIPLDTPKFINVTKDVWGKVKKSTLKPLLEAYTETIKEKDDLVITYEKELAELGMKCKDLVTENEKLYAEVEAVRRQTDVRSEEYKIIHEDSTLIQEQNDLLTSQLEIQKGKVHELHSAYQQRVSSLTKDLEDICSKYHSCRGELLTLRGQYSVLREEYDKLKSDVEMRVPLSVHNASIAECRRLLEELRTKYEADRHTLNNKVLELQLEKPLLESQVATIISEKTQLQTLVHNLEMKLKGADTKLEEMNILLSTSLAEKDAARRQLSKAMLFAEDLVAEQEALLKQLHRKKAETKSMAELGSNIVSRMGCLRDKLKTVQKGAWQELDQIESRIKQQEEGVHKMKQEYKQELIRLQNLLQQKEDIIEQLKLEKSKTDLSIDTEWQSEDPSIKEFSKHVNFVDENH